MIRRMRVKAKIEVTVMVMRSWRRRWRRWRRSNRQSSNKQHRAASSFVLPGFSEK